MSDKKSGASEAALGWAILLCVFAGLGYLIWLNFNEQIRSGIRWLRYGEMWVASLFLDSDYTVDWNGSPINYKEMMNVARDIPHEKLDNSFLTLLSTVALTPYLFLVIGITACFAIWALFKGPGTEHRSKYDINSLIKKQSNIFPIISPMIGFNPSQMEPRPPGAPVPAELPLFAEALGPEEWVVYSEIPIKDKRMDEDATAKAFGKQLGKRWRGAKHLDPYMQVMLAAFCLKSARRRADADTMMGNLAKCWTEKDGLKVDRTLLREARSVLGNSAISSNVLKKCNEHAWETTAMIRALNTAREDGGVLAPAQFIWLRGHNRLLWYPLNNLGRQSLHMEALGAMAHYKAEKLARRPIPRPKVGDAVKSIMDYMLSEKARALPQIDYKNSKKRGLKKLKTA